MKIKFILLLIITILIGFLSSKIVYAFNNKKVEKKYNAYILQIGPLKESDIISQSVNTINQNFKTIINNYDIANFKWEQYSKTTTRTMLTMSSTASPSRRMALLTTISACAAT